MYILYDLNYKFMNHDQVILIILNSIAKISFVAKLKCQEHIEELKANDIRQENQIQCVLLILKKNVRETKLYLKHECLVGSFKH